ncbi:MAG: hypothetical protein KAT48_00330 [Bacteroidales bacterium]|nr:hypothetical protein [Bacteroidales bacterium]
MKINAVRLFLLILGLFLLFFTGPSLAEIEYTFVINPASPSMGQVVNIYADSSWACADNNSGSMKFNWLQDFGGDSYSQTVNYFSNLTYNGTEYDYFSYYRVRNEGDWYIYYQEHELDYGSGDIIGGGTPLDYETISVVLPEFSSYIFVLISFISIYFILRKKIVS